MAEETTKKATTGFFSPLPWRRLGLLGGLCLLLAACAGPAEETLLQGATMGTSYSVKLVDLPAEQDLQALQTELERRLEQVNAAMSTYLPDSELSRFNQNPSTDWVTASPKLLAVLQTAQEISRLSDGAFDISVGPLVNLWGFGPTASRGQAPSLDQIQAARKRVGYQLLQLRADPPALRKARPDLYLDLSAIAKGYAVDLLAAYLNSQGLTNFLVEIGGEVWGRGHNRHGRPWRIAIEKPDPGSRSVHDIVELDGQGIATSGDYRNFFEQAGNRYSHSIDPASGRPVQHALASVTVLAPSVMRADALATALLVLGPERGLALAEQQGLAALFIMREGEGFSTRTTPEFERYRVQPT